MTRRLKSLAVILSVLLLTSCSYQNIILGLFAIYDDIHTSDSYVSIEASSAIPDISDPIAPYFAKMNCGSSKTLDGTCLFINVFLSDSTSSFNTGEKARAIFLLGRAANYLTQQAKAYDKDLSTIYKERDLVFDYKTEDDIPTDLDNFMWGYPIIENLYEQNDIENLIEKYDAENISFLFHVNKTGRSYALASRFEYDGLYDNEIAVIFSSDFTEDNEVSGTTEYVYAHEILHLFGAIDLYYPFNPDDERIKLAEAYFPNDIMLVYAYDINSAFISNLDAYLIGWCDYLEKENHIFIIDPYE